MSGDWIKLEHTTIDKPEVWRMAALLKISPEAVLGHLVRVWCWADQQSTNVDNGRDTIVDVLPSTIDAVAHLHGFANALKTVHWLVVDKNGLTFPGLQGFISETAKIRALRNRAAAKWRAKSSTNVDENPSTKIIVREEYLNTPYPTEQVGGVTAGDKSPDKRKAKPRAVGSNPRAKGTNPRATGSNPRKGNGQRAPRSDTAVQALGVKLGVLPRPGETMEAYRARVLKADDP